ncbi:hypothetical protein L910_4622 [Vibrio fluvialis PG41]|uniref:Uncharacterized protein n=1 Tax=Vibrio fluvialis PG41 TaxID=1336752 RepID=S7JLA2_VIBFL|nr:hypothetical protein L910_4622 [Vibrio fluvialis PG41]
MSHVQTDKWQQNTTNYDGDISLITYFLLSASKASETV